MNPKDKIKPFNIYWCMYILVMVLLIIGITLIGNKLDIKGKYTLLIGFDIFLYITLRIYKFCLRYCEGFEYNYYNELVCYTCSQSAIMCLLGCIFKSQTVMAYCVTIGSVGALLALIMPEEYFENSKPFSIAAIGFYGWHGLLVTACISFFTLGLYTPVLKDCIPATLWLLVLTMISHLTNIFLRKTKIFKEANYTYTYIPENPILIKLHKKIPIPFVYLLPLIPAFGLVSFIIIVILRLFIQ